MPRLILLFIVPAFLTAIFGYPSTVPSIQGGPALEHRPADAPPETGNLRGETDLQAPRRVAPVAADEEDANLRQELPPGLNRAKRMEESSDGNEEVEEDGDDDSDMFMEPQETDEEVVKVEDEEEAKEAESAPGLRDNHGLSQHFFPSFAPVFSLGHSRPPQLFHQENYYSKSRAPPVGPDYNPFRAYRDNSYKVPITIDEDQISSNILGSGNFGVLKGGTYYNEEDRGEQGLFSPFYNNGHGRPYTANPRPQKYTNGDFFANFRDFADINTPNKGSFSEYVIVYVNKNGSRSDGGGDATEGKAPRPKNIIEQLTMLDGGYATESDEAKPEKKMSQHKRKLALMRKEKANKEKKSGLKKREQLEPLLALS